MKKYKGQVLEIVLVLLLVGSIIAFALYARFIRESERVVDEKASAKAHELTETLIGLLSNSNYEKIRSDEALELLDCDSNLLSTTGCRKENLNIEDLNRYFQKIDLESDFSSFDFDGDYCFSEIAMKFGLGEDEITLSQDESFSLFLNKADWDSCDIQFLLTNNGESDGFVMSTLYGEYENGELKKFKDYEFEDILGFSYSEPLLNWQPYSSGVDFLKFPGDFEVKKGEFKLHEVRFKSLGGSSNLRWEVSSFGCELSDYIMMEVGSTCGGNYSGKSFVLPSESFSPSIFDYAIFNGRGDLKPQPIPEGIGD